MGTNQLEPNAPVSTTENQEEASDAVADVRRHNNATSPAAEGIPLVTFNEQRMGIKFSIFSQFCCVLLCWVLGIFR